MSNANDPNANEELNKAMSGDEIQKGGGDPGADKGAGDPNGTKGKADGTCDDPNCAACILSRLFMGGGPRLRPRSPFDSLRSLFSLGGKPWMPFAEATSLIDSGVPLGDKPNETIAAFVAAMGVGYIRNPERRDRAEEALTRLLERIAKG